MLSARRRTVSCRGPLQEEEGGCRKEEQYHQLHRKVKKRQQCALLQSRMAESGPPEEGAGPSLPCTKTEHPQQPTQSDCPRLPRVGSRVESKGKHGSDQILPSDLFQGLSDTEICYIQHLFRFIKLCFSYFIFFLLDCINEMGL